jgi:hypothetical protein
MQKTKITIDEQSNLYLSIGIRHCKVRKAVYLSFTKEEIEYKEGYNTVKMQPYEMCNFNINIADMPRFNQKKIDAILSQIDAIKGEILPLFLACADSRDKAPILALLQRKNIGVV